MRLRQMHMLKRWAVLMSVLVLILICISGCDFLNILEFMSGSSDDAVGKVDDKQPSQIIVWVEHDTHKVMRTESEPRHDDSSTLKLYAARNEHAAGQIVVWTTDGLLKDVRLGIDDLVCERGSTISKDSVSIYVVEYVYLQTEKAHYPDPLMPFDAVSSLDIKPQEVQPFWIEVQIPEHTPAGIYNGSVQLHSGNNVFARVPVELRVWDFDVPIVPSTRTAFGISIPDMTRMEQSMIRVGEEGKMLAAYIDMLLEHRISPSITWESFDDWRDIHYLLDDPRMTAFNMPYTDDYEVFAESVEYARERDWLEKGYFWRAFAWGDEPFLKEHYEEFKRWRALLDKVDPTLKVAVPYYRSPEFAQDSSIIDHLAEEIDIWVPVTYLLNQNVMERKKVRARQREGDEFWWYVCMGPGHPYANYFVNMNAVNNRVLLWQQKQWGVEGLLYWCVNYWAQTRDPWLDMQTLRHLNENIYGDGSLLYPGSRIGQYGPVPSIRLKLIRAGMYDYEYVMLLEKLEGREGIEPFLSRASTGLTSYVDADILVKLRLEIAERLESLLSDATEG